MALNSPLAPPDQLTVAAAAATALDEQVTAVRPKNDASKTDLTDVVCTAGSDLAPLEAQRRSTRASFLAEPAVLRAVANATLAVPAALGVDADAGPLGRPNFPTSYAPGGQVPSHTGRARFPIAPCGLVERPTRGRQGSERPMTARERRGFSPGPLRERGESGRQQQDGY